MPKATASSKYDNELDYEVEMGNRLAQLDAKADQAEIDAEWAVIARTRLEGASVWAQEFGHVLRPLAYPGTRKAFVAMLAAQDEDTRSVVEAALNHCTKNDPYLFDANYPMLEYYLWVVILIYGDRPFRPLAIPLEICDWIQSIKPEEYLHYRPSDWCYECGYRYPALLYGITHDFLAFLKTRHSESEIDAMRTPFRGKPCVVCDGEIVSYWGMSDSSRDRRDMGVRWEGSPAQRLCEAKREEWNAEIDAVNGGLADVQGVDQFFDRSKYRDDYEAARAEFLERRRKRPGVRLEHKPSVDDILRMWRR